jgi:phosphate transport system substrate-binding protein
VKEVAVSKEPGGECIAPTAETIADGSYPISRTLYVYVNKAKAAENAAVRAYVDFYLAEGTISSVLETVPYVNLPADKLAESRSTWDASE